MDRVEDVVRIGSPLPQRYATSGEPLGGRLKVRPEDFLVEEIPLYDPCGEGEHIYLGIEKRNVAHGELISCVCRHFGVREHAVGFAGMKDKAAITRQTLSVHADAAPESVDIDHDRIGVLWATRHRNKLRRGHLIGNRFSIRIRDVDPLQVPRVRRMLETLEQVGVPQYFDRQRFGYRHNNHVIGRHVLSGSWDAALSELLGAGGAVFPEHQRERREHYDAGRIEDAMAMWTPADRCELAAIRALTRGRSPRDACWAVGRTALLFWVSALQSAAFNRVLDRRLEDGEMGDLREGDLAWIHTKRSVFAVDADELVGDELERRLQQFDISPSGPLWGPGMTRAAGRTDEIECEALQAAGIELEHFAPFKKHSRGARRPLRAAIRDVEVEAGTDEHGGFIRLAFDLPRGVYATVVMREIMKNDQAS